MATTDLWTYPEETIGDVDVTGFTVEATDGSIGKVDEASYEVGAGYIVVDTGPWIFGRKVVIPAGTITGVDTANETIAVSLTKEQIKDSPPFDKDTVIDETYRTRVGEYYAPFFGHVMQPPTRPARP
jgi:hypothetical protein